MNSFLSLFVDKEEGARCERSSRNPVREFSIWDKEIDETAAACSWSILNNFSILGHDREFFIQYKEIDSLQ
jgi:hypothetical protein